MTNYQQRKNYKKLQKNYKKLQETCFCMDGHAICAKSNGEFSGFL